MEHMLLKRIEDAIDKIQQHKEDGKRFRPSASKVVDQVLADLRQGIRTPPRAVLTTTVVKLLDRRAFDVPPMVAMDSTGGSHGGTCHTKSSEALPATGQPERKKARRGTVLAVTEYEELPRQFHCKRRPPFSLQSLHGYNRIRQHLLDFLSPFFAAARVAQQGSQSGPGRMTGDIRFLTLVGAEDSGRTTLARAMAGSIPDIAVSASTVDSTSPFHRPLAKFIEVPAVTFHGLHLRDTSERGDRPSNPPQKLLEELFQLIENSGPCLVVLDDFDHVFTGGLDRALGGSGSSGGRGGSGTEGGGPANSTGDFSRHVSRASFAAKFKSEVAALHNRCVVFVATCEAADRLDRHLFNPACGFLRSNPVVLNALDDSDREAILRSALEFPGMTVPPSSGPMQTFPVAADVNVSQIARLTRDCQTVGDLERFLRQASEDALVRQFKDEPVVSEHNSVESPNGGIRGGANPLLEANSLADQTSLVNSDVDDSDIVQEVVDAEEAVSSGSKTALTTRPLVSCRIYRRDMETAWSKFGRLLVREGFVASPDISLEQVGGMQEPISLVSRKIIDRIRNADTLRRHGLPVRGGALLWGPPGCGKTILAQAIAHECQAKFILVSGSEFMNKYLGESENEVRKTFARARANAPCLIFFDEFDAICPNRELDNHEVSKRVVNALLVEMDGAVKRDGVFVVCATNRPQLLDKAMLRKGRIDHIVYIPPPTAADRISILQATALRYPRFSVDPAALEQLGPRTVGFSGADLAYLLTEAAESSLVDSLVKGERRRLSADDMSDGGRATEAAKIPIESRHLEDALAHIHPSLSPEMLGDYERLKEVLGSGR